MEYHKLYANKSIRIEWRDIKIGQAFLFTGCHGIGVKTCGNYFVTIDEVATTTVDIGGAPSSLDKTRKINIPCRIVEDKFYRSNLYSFYELPVDIKKACSFTY